MRGHTVVSVSRPSILNRNRLLSRTKPRIVKRMTIRQSRPSVLVVKRLTSRTLSQKRQNSRRRTRPYLGHPLRHVRNRYFNSPSLRPIRTSRSHKSNNTIKKHEKQRRLQTLITHGQSHTIRAPQTTFTNRLNLMTSHLMRRQTRAVGDLRPTRQHPKHVNRHPLT